MKQGSRLNKVQARQVERWLRENADLTARNQAAGLSELLGEQVADVTVTRWRKRFETPRPSEAKRNYPIALAGWELKTFRRLMEYMVVPIPSDFGTRISLEIPGLDEVTTGDETLRFVVGNDWNITALWFTSDELKILHGIFALSDRRRGSHLADDLADLFAFAVEFASRAFWQAVRKSIELQQTSPMIKRIPKGRVPVVDQELEREWLRLGARKLRVQVKEFQASAALAVTG